MKPIDVHKAFNRSMWYVLPALTIIGLLSFFLVNYRTGYLICFGTFVLWLGLLTLQFYAFGRWWKK